MATAIDSFHAQLLFLGMAGQNLDLKLGLKSLSGPVAWAQLRPEQWTDIVRDGDEIRLGLGGSARVIEGSPDPRMFTFKYLDGNNYKYATMYLPETITLTVSYV